LQSESNEANNNDAQHSDFIDMESAERKLPVPSEDTNDGHCNNEDAVAAEDDAGGALPIDEELPPQEYASDINYSDAVESNGDDDDDELESLPALFSGNAKRMKILCRKMKMELAALLKMMHHFMIRTTTQSRKKIKQPTRQLASLESSFGELCAGSQASNPFLRK
jgi:hypothetical protein